MENTQITGKRSMRLKTTGLLVLFCLFFHAIGIAEIYKWTDENGKTHFSDAPPNKDKVEKLDEDELAKRISSFTQVSVQFVPIDFGVNQQANRANSLVMYTTTRCGYCEKARKYFAKNNIDYAEKNITLSDKFKAEFKDFGGTGVPVMFMGEYRMQGFSEARFDTFYAKAKK